MSDELALETTLRGAEVAGLFDPEMEESLSTSERRLLTMLLASDDQVNVTIPDEITAADLWEALALCCKVFVRVRQGQTQLKMLIGRALVLAQSKPEIWQSRGHRSFDAFMTDENGLPGLTGISRPELYKAKSIAEKIGSLPLEKTRAIGFSKLAKIAQVTEAGNSNFNSWVDKAERMTIKELDAEIAKSDLALPAGSLEDVTLAWVVKKTEKEQIVSFMDDPEVHAVCGTDRPGGILQWLMAEADSAGWRSQCDGAEKLKELVEAKKGGGK